MDENALKNELSIVEETVGALVVQDKQTYEVAGNVILDLDAMRRKIVDYWSEPKKKAFEAHKAITQKESQMLRPLDERRKIVDKKISDYLTEERRKRDEAQRIEDERRKRIEERQKERLLKKADRAAESGDEDKAQDFIQAAEDVYVPPVVVESEITQTTHTDSGTISQRQEIDVRILDTKKVLQEIIAGNIPIGVVTISETKLKQHVKLFKLRSLPGCVIEERTAATFRRGK